MWNGLLETPSLYDLGDNTFVIWGAVTHDMLRNHEHICDASSLMISVHGAKSQGAKVGPALLTVTETYYSLVVNSMLLNGSCYEIV